MTFNALFRIFFFQIMAAGFLPVLLNGRIDPFSGTAWLILLITGYFRGERTAEKIKTFSGTTVTLITLGFVLLFLGELSLNDGDIILSIIHLAMAVSLVKLFTIRSLRDYLYLFLISFGFLLISTTFTINPGFLAAAGWFMICGMICMMLLEIRNASRRFSRPRPEPENTGKDIPPAVSLTGRLALPPRSLFVLGLVMFLVIILLTGPTFAVLPRMFWSFWHLDLLNHQNLSGFSESTRLGDLTSIRDNSTVVMHVKTDIPPDELPPDLKWRGIALDQYDGRGWSIASQDLTPIPFEVGGLYHLGERRRPERMLRQEFFLEPLSSRVIFMAWRPVGITPDLLTVFRTTTGSYFSTQLASNKSRYTVYSDIYQPPPDIRSSPPAPLPARISPVLLAIPQRSARLEALVNLATANAVSPYAKALALKDLLGRQCQYSTEVPAAPAGQDPVEFFVLDHRRGHCEYFASALAIMLRYAGIPSRVVNGFQRGDLNFFSRSFTVRQSHAHSWTEAWFAGAGWTALDATPPAPELSRLPIWRTLRDIVDYLDYFWATSVVSYDARDQARLVHSLRNQWREWRDSVAGWFSGWKDRARQWSGRLMLEVTGRLSSGTGWLTPLLAASLALAIFFARRRLAVLIHFRRGLKTTPRQQLATLLYRRFLKLAARRGYRPPPQQTPREFIRQLPAVLPADLLDGFVDIYYRLRFDPGCPEPDLIRELETRLSRLEICWRGKKQLAS